VKSAQLAYVETAQPASLQPLPRPWPELAVIAEERARALPDHLRVVSFQLDPPNPTRTDASAQNRRCDLPWCD